MTVAPELRPALRWIPRPPVDRAWARRLARFVLRRFPAAKVDGVTLEQIGGVRVYRPATRRCDGALLWIHGGGLVIGRAVQDDRFCGTAARELGIVVVSVEYRKAPEHPFPAALDDCNAGWEWLQRNAVSLGISPARVAIGGQSAGGGLAAGLGLLARDRGEIPVAFQLLIYPMIDDRQITPSSQWIVPVWTRELNRFGWSSYLGDRYGTDDVPAIAAAARATDLTGLPPAYIHAGTLDGSVHEDIDYATRLLAAGVPTELHVFPGAPHGFDGLAMGTAIADQANATAEAALAKVLTP